MGQWASRRSTAQPDTQYDVALDRSPQAAPAPLGPRPNATGRPKSIVIVVPFTTVLRCPVRWFTVARPTYLARAAPYPTMIDESLPQATCFRLHLE